MLFFPCFCVARQGIPPGVDNAADGKGRHGGRLGQEDARLVRTAHRQTTGAQDSGRALKTRTISSRLSPKRVGFLI